MSLYTKSIQKPAELSDGIRICIMRRPDDNAQYDMLLQPLAPSSELLDQYHTEKITWSDFEVQFRQEVIEKKFIYIDLVAHLAQKFDITLLCWEKTPDMCHRRLVAEACKKYNKNLQVVIK